MSYRYAILGSGRQGTAAAFDLAGHRRHAIERAIGVKQFARANADAAAGPTFHFQPHPAREILTEVE